MVKYRRYDIYTTDNTSYTYNKANQLLTETKGITTTEYTYDFNGNLLERDDGTTEEIYGYDVKNRQIYNYKSYSYDMHYSYRPDGLRSSSISCTSYNEISFIWDGMNLVHEYYMDTYNWGDVENIYIYGINLIKSYMGCLIDSKQSATKYYYFYNAHGDVTGLVNANNGYITKNYQYDAFGNEKNPSGSDMNPFRYCGEYFDKETGTYYLRARYYDPKLGRFLCEDPIGAGLNWYTYCNSNPVMYIDPLGLDYYIYYGEDQEFAAEQYKKQLEEEYPDVPIHMIFVDTPDTFYERWEAMGIENGEEVTIDGVIINLHGNPDNFYASDEKVIDLSKTSNDRSIPTLLTYVNKVISQKSIENTELIYTIRRLTRHRAAFLFGRYLVDFGSS